MGEAVSSDFGFMKFDLFGPSLVYCAEGLTECGGIACDGAGLPRLLRA